jgi:hypothetical protein
MLLVLHGHADSESNEFLKQLHVFNEIREIDQRVRDRQGAYDLEKIKVLKRNDQSNQLQFFINTVIEYAKSLEVTPKAIVKQIPKTTMA